MEMRSKMLGPAALAMAATIGGTAGAGFAAEPSAPARTHLDIIEAAIEDIPPLEWGRIPSRGVRLRVRVAALPPCTSATRALEYGFLVDADRDAATGAANPVFAALGVDARLAARCDPPSGRFVSAVGEVTLSGPDAAGVVTIDLTTTVGRLPSIDFSWIAYAAENGILTRVPEAPRHGAWTTFERGLP